MSLFFSLFGVFALFCFSAFDRVFRRLIFPLPASGWRGALQDLQRPKSELVLENALLRHQLAILQPQSKLPRLTLSDRF